MSATSAGAQGVIVPQTTGDPAETARFRVGTLRFTPTITANNIGVDNNVFNDDVNRRQDTTAAVGPAVSLWMNIGRSRLSGQTGVQYLYFKQYENQRSWNVLNAYRWDFPLGRFTPFLTGTYSNLKDRPGFEVDARARRREESLGAGTTFRFSGKTDLLLAVRRIALVYDANQSFLGVDLANALNRESSAETLQFNVRLTPLTTFVARAEGIQDRFAGDPNRSADSYSLVGGFDLRPQALISGQAFVGAKRFTPLTGAMPTFAGAVASVTTGLAVKRTQLQLIVSRDVVYSFEVLQPYYALTSVGLTITQRITPTWDVVGRGARQSMAYRNLTTVADLPERTDRSWQLGTGIGYRVGRSLRIGFDANYVRRESPILAFRTFSGVRAGASITYGLSR